MNTLFLLAIGFLLLLMSQRYLRRVLGALTFRTLAGAEPDSADVQAPAPIRAGHGIAASGGILSLFGIALALAWGWAPVFVWILLGAALLSGLVTTALSWLQSLTPGRHGLDALGPVCGDAFRFAMCAALAGILLVWAPLLALGAASLIAVHPAALAPLLLQVLFALVVWRQLANRPDVAILTGAIGGIAAILVGLAAARTMPTVLDPLPETVVTAIAVFVIVLAFAVAKHGLDRLAPATGLVCAGGAVATAAVLFVAIAVTRADAAYLDYHAAPNLPGALPLVAVCASFGVMPSLAVALASSSHREGRVLSGSTTEGLIAALVLIVLLTAPAIDPGSVIELPGWESGIDPNAATAYFLSAIAAVGSGLPAGGDWIASATAAVLAGLSILSLTYAMAALRGLAARVAPRTERSRGLMVAGIIALPIVLSLAIAGRGAMATGVWLAAGELALLFAAGVLLTAGLAAMRLKRRALAALAPGIGLALAFWWAAIVQTAVSARAGDYPSLGAQIAVLAIGVVCNASLVVNFAKLRTMRRVRDTAP